jgi:hypothetical protein
MSRLYQRGCCDSGHAEHTNTFRSAGVGMQELWRGLRLPASDAAVTQVLLDFDAFFLEHRLCGDLDGGANDEHAWLACVACGARIERPVETSEE